MKDIQCSISTRFDFKSLMEQLDKQKKENEKRWRENHAKGTYEDNIVKDSEIAEGD